MNTSSSPTVVIVPGLRDHVADHWQTLLAERLDDARIVPPLEHHKLDRAARVAALDAVLADIAGPVVTPVSSTGGTHGYLPGPREMESSFYIVGEGVPAGRGLGAIDMRDIAPTLAAKLGVQLPRAQGRNRL